MSDKKDTSGVIPKLKLSRCSRKPRKRSVNNSVSHNAEKPAKRKRKPQKTDIPIPSFSPVNKVEEIDASILDTPEKEKEHEVVLLQDDDDDDDALLLGPPTFATLTRKQSPIEDEKKPAEYINREKRTFAGAQQASNKETLVEENDSKQQVDELPDEIIQTIENLLRQVMDSDNVTVRDVVNRVATKHGYSKDDKAMRKLIRAHVRSFMKQANEADDSPQESLAEALTKTDTSGTRSATLAPCNDDKSSNTAKPCNNAATVKPDEEDLTVSIDGLFLQAEGQVATRSNFLMALEGEYGAKLHKTSRAFVKERLKGLKDGTIEPTVSLPSTPCFGDAAKASTLQRNESPVPDNSDMDIPMDDDTEPEINTALDQTAAAKKYETEKTNVEADQPQPSPEKGNEKPRKLGRSTKIARTVEAVEITDESNPSSGEMSGRGGNQEKPPVKEVPKKPPAPRKPRAPRAKKGTCALCTSCTCTIGKEANVIGTPANMSRNDAEIERALIRRTKKLEGLVDKYQGLLDNINRELKKHRRAIWKKQEAQVSDGRRFAFGDSRFLPDADVWDEQADAVHLEALPTAVAEEAKSTLFGNGNCQVTLTQMFGGGDKKDENTSQDAGSAKRDSEKDTAVMDTCSQNVTDEDKEEVPGGHESVVDHSDLDSEAEPVDRIHRLTWRRGTRVETQSTLLRGSGAWSAITTKRTPRDAKPDLLQSIVLPSKEDDTLRSDFHDGDKYNCAWDALFADDISGEDDERMDQLLELFETVMSQDDEPVTSDTSTPVHSLTQRSEFETVPLTQRGQEIANKIEEEIIADPMRLQPIEAVCPKWRDNIRYALSQRGPAEIRQALERVRRSMNNLQNTKQKVSTVWQRQEVVLQLFETSLSASLSRLPPSEESRENGVVNSEGNVPTPTSPTHLRRATVLSPIIESNESLS